MPDILSRCLPEEEVLHYAEQLPTRSLQELLWEQYTLFCNYGASLRSPELQNVQVEIEKVLHRLQEFYTSGNGAAGVKDVEMAVIRLQELRKTEREIRKKMEELVAASVQQRMKETTLQVVNDELDEEAAASRLLKQCSASGGDAEEPSSSPEDQLMSGTERSVDQSGPADHDDAVSEEEVDAVPAAPAPQPAVSGRAALLNFSTNSFHFTQEDFDTANKQICEELHIARGGGAAAAAAAVAEAEAKAKATQQKEPATSVEDIGLSYIRQNIDIQHLCSPDREALLDHVVLSLATAAEDGDEGDDSFVARISAEVRGLYHTGLLSSSSSSVSRVCLCPDVVVHTKERGVFDAEEVRVQLHLEVVPISGPMAGQVVGVFLRIPAGYPFVAPRAHLQVDLPHRHSSGVATDRVPHLLSLTYGQYAAATPWRAPAAPLSAGAMLRCGDEDGIALWRPEYTLRTVVTALQGLFDAAEFSATAAELQNQTLYNEELHNGRMAMYRDRVEQREATQRLKSTNEKGGAEEAASLLPPLPPVLFNGPFLTKTPPLSYVSPAAGEVQEDARDGADNEEEEEVDPNGEAGTAEDETSPRRRGRARLRYEEPPNSYLSGPWRGCWGHLLYSSGAGARGVAESHDNDAVLSEANPKVIQRALLEGALYVRLVHHQGSVAPAKLRLVPLPSDVVYETTPPRRQRGAGSKTSAWATVALQYGGTSTLASQDGVLETCGDEREHVYRVVAEEHPSQPHDAAVLQHAKWFDLSLRNASEATATGGTPSQAEQVQGGPRCFAVLLDIPEGQQVSVVFSTDLQEAMQPVDWTNSSTLPTAVESEASQGAELRWWPRDPQDGDGGEESERVPATMEQGTLVEVPYDEKPINAGAAAVNSVADITATWPRSIRFHMANRAFPMQLSESTFFMYQRLQNQQYGPAGIVGSGAGCSYISAAPYSKFRSAQARATKDAAQTMHRHAFWGWRTLFLPCFSSKITTLIDSAFTAEDRSHRSSDTVALSRRMVEKSLTAAERMAIGRFTASCVQLHRSADASTAYRAPFRPLAVLRIFSLVASHTLSVLALNQKNKSTTTASISEGDAARFVAHLNASLMNLIALLGVVAAVEPSFLGACGDLLTSPSNPIDSHKEPSTDLKALLHSNVAELSTKQRQMAHALAAICVELYMAEVDNAEVCEAARARCASIRGGVSAGNTSTAKEARDAVAVPRQLICGLLREITSSS